MIKNIERRKPTSIIFNNKLLDRLIVPFGADMAAEKSFGMETDEFFIPRWQGSAPGDSTAIGVGASLALSVGTATGTSNANAVGT